MRPAHLVLVLGLVLALGCADRAAPPPKPVTLTSSALRVRGTPMPELTAIPRGETRLTWAPALLGAKPPVVRIEVSNAGTAPLDVSRFTARLEATRGGATFECPGEAPVGREASSVAPSSTATFDRTFDCVLPLPGPYETRVVATFGSEANRTEQRAEHPFEIVVAASDTYAPRPLEGVDGVFIAVGTGRLHAASSAEGHATLAVAIVNAGDREVKLPALRMGIAVLREGRRASCKTDAVPVGAPDMLAPGRSHVETIAVECIGLGAAGRYELSARVVAGDRTTSIGPLRVDVTENPLLIDPERSRRHDPTGAPSK